MYYREGYVSCSCGSWELKCHLKPALYLQGSAGEVWHLHSLPNPYSKKKKKRLQNTVVKPNLVWKYTSLLKTKQSYN